MTKTQIILVISLTALAVGSVFFLLSPPLQNEAGVKHEVIQEPAQGVGIEKKPIEANTFDKGEGMENYKVVDCYYKSQTPVVIIKKDDIVVNNVTGVPFVVCISAGEKRTGGYNLSLNDISINRDNFQIFIDLFLKVPAKGEMVTQAFTYPSIGVEINEVLDVGEWEVIVTIEQKNGEPLLLRKSFTFSN
ncbi:protease complex subunit PrcB family protein [Petrotoga olearia]|nr:protease complex subunit PrcB family protein [Petrotoga olearia]RMA75317.1 protease stability complex PrcB-like protein [Petrotoga olearia]